MPIPADAIVDLIRLLHLVGLAVGIGGAIFADLLGLMMLFSKSRPEYAAILRTIHRFVLSGLAILAITGVAVAAMRFSPDTLPQKVIAKSVLVVVLAANAVLIRRFLLPLAENRPTPLLAYFSGKDILLTAFAGSVSFAFWTAAVLFAALGAFKGAPASALLALAVWLWLACLGTLAAALFVSRFVLFHLRECVTAWCAVATSVATTLLARAGLSLPAIGRPSVRSAGHRLTASRFGSPHRNEPVFASRAQTTHTLRAVPAETRWDGNGKAHQSATAVAALDLHSDAPCAPVQPEMATGRRPVSAASAPKPALRLAVSRPEPPVADLWSDMPGRRPPERLAIEQQEADRMPAGKAVPAALQGCRGPILGTAGISLVTNLLMLTGPLFMLQVYDRVLTSKSVPTLAALLGLVACLFTFMGILELIRSRILVRISLRLDRYLNEHVFDSVTRIVPVAAGAARTRFLHDLENIRNFAAGPAPAALFDLPWTPVYFLVIFLFHWVLGLIAVVGAVVLISISIINEMLARKPAAAAAKHLAGSISVAEAGRRNAESLHAMGMTNIYRQYWLKEHRKALAVHARASDIAGSLTIVTRILRLFLQSLMLGAGAYFAIRQDISPGVIIAVSIILARALAPIEQVIGQWRGFLAARQGFRRIHAELASVPDRPNHLPLPSPVGHVSVENLYAAAPGSTEPILKGLSFCLEPGDVLAVIGANAAGKSTLARTLVGVWAPLRGNVRLDGAAFDQWDRQQLGRYIGYLPQAVEMFDGSVAENVSRFDPHADWRDIVAAAEKAHIHDLVLRLPDGYATRVGEYGAALSGGQCQRIGLARALYKDPTLIVLDEPGANLDPDGEQALFGAIESARCAGQTAVIITHETDIVRAANKILVLIDGRQVAFGSKEEVLRSRRNTVVPAADPTVSRKERNIQPIQHQRYCENA